MVMSPTLGNPAINEQSANAPAGNWRQSTFERNDILPSESGTISASTQQIERNIDGSGFVYGIVLRMVVTTAANAAATAFQEDAPWAALDRVVFRDVNGELINLSGYELYLVNLYMKNYSYRFLDGSSNTNLYSTTTGAGATGGSLAFNIRVPVAINRRDLIGAVGNQDRANTYMLRTNIAASASIYSTAPTTAGTFALSKFYENYAVPMRQSPTGQPQDVIPPWYGTLHFLTSAINESVPSGSSTVTHYLRQIGRTIRNIILIFRSNGSRSTANSNQPTSIRFKIGDDTIFYEDFTLRQLYMYERYGFDAPNGVLCYDTIHDNLAGAGAEYGNDYYHTQLIQNARFEISYPSGFGSTNNTLTTVTDELLIPPAMGR